MNTALRAESEELLFKSQEHKEFYFKHMGEVDNKDVYNKALFYTLGIANETRRMIGHIYDFESNSVRPQCLFESWITSGSARAVRLAFNLYCNDTPSIYKYEENQEETLKECKYYCIDDVFCCEYAPFFLEAVRLRYPEYFRSVKEVL
ncbi:DUF6075 family protein [Ohessyouella blattaphilus]|uniref:DUF6075 family protein n=1 Tax=Ohessyouella blattaphilus TaxID=2949333 RepID=A0ABT1EJD1_9FIRM|nr:DUF6075 family protein [Ohessyouella blattaphilus]MCP1110804.1 DUF6075 family protein [Ohessyouella blattaphilus]MCR8564198.1 DUF6075 family protein [Ohessyouella blattaphilus]